MRVCPNQSIREGICLTTFCFGPDCLRQIFQVNLMANTGSGGNNSKIIKSFLTPFQEIIAFAVSLILTFHVFLKSLRRAVIVHHNRVVDDQMNRIKRVNGFGRTAEIDHRVAHSGQIHNGRNTGEVLHEHAGRTVSDFVSRCLWSKPIRNSLNIFFFNGSAIFVAEKVFQKDFQRSGQFRNAFQSVLFRFFQIEIGIGAAAHFEGAFAIKTVQ